MCIFSFFRKINIEKNTKVKRIAYIVGRTCCNISLIEGPNVAFHKAKQKERKELERLDGEFFHPLYVHMCHVDRTNYLEEKSILSQLKIFMETDDRKFQFS